MHPRVLHINRVSYLGGTERVILTLAEVLRDKFEVVIACPGEGDLPAAARNKNIETAPIPIDRTRITADPWDLMRYAALLWRGSRFIEKFCRRNDIVLLHAHHPVGALYAMRARSKLNIPLIVHLHDSLPARPLYAFALKQAARNADRLVACSGAGRELFRSVGGDPTRVEIVHNGLSPDFVKDAAASVPTNLGEPGPHVGVFAAIETRKGQDVFLRAADLVLQSHPNAVFWLVGRAPDEKEDFIQRLSSLAAEGRLKGRVRFTGHRSDVAGLMKAMDLMVLPSLFHESLPMSLIEAMSLGVPCIASRVGGTNEIIADRRNGRLVAPGDVNDLADAMLEMLGPAGPSLGKRGAEDAARRFSGERFADEIAAVYNDVRAERVSRRGRRKPYHRNLE